MPLVLHKRTSGSFIGKLLLRHYEPIWRQLKAQGHGGLVTVSAHRRLHARIIKAVKKEKWLDTVYKIDIAPAIGALTYTRTADNPDSLTFHLKLVTSHFPNGRVRKVSFSEEGLGIDLDEPHLDEKEPT